MKRYTPIIVTTAFMILIALPALAAGGGLVDSFVSWLWTNIGAGLVELCVIAGGVLLMFGGHSWYGIGVMAVGSIIAAHYSDIASTLSGG